MNLLGAFKFKPEVQTSLVLAFNLIWTVLDKFKSVISHDLNIALSSVLSGCTHLSSRLIMITLYIPTHPSKLDPRQGLTEMMCYG